jgi:hypothetical protein
MRLSSPRLFFVCRNGQRHTHVSCRAGRVRDYDDVRVLAAKRRPTRRAWNSGTTPFRPRHFVLSLSARVATLTRRHFPRHPVAASARVRCLPRPPTCALARCAGRRREFARGFPFISLAIAPGHLRRPRQRRVACPSHLPTQPSSFLPGWRTRPAILWLYDACGRAGLAAADYKQPTFISSTPIMFFLKVHSDNVFFLKVHSDNVWRSILFLCKQNRKAIAWDEIFESSVAVNGSIARVHTV